MVNQEVVDYIKKYKDSYSEESIRKQLINSGYNESEIDEAYRGNSTMKTNNSAESQVTNLENAHYAGFWIRVVAYILDVLILSPLLIITLFVISLKFSLEPTIMSLLISVITLILWGLYEIIMVGKKGATLGKMVIGAKIVKDNGDEIDMNSSAIRFAGKIVNNFTIYIGYIMVAFTGKKQGLHDMMAQTYVIYKK